MRPRRAGCFCKIRRVRDKPRLKIFCLESELVPFAQTLGLTATRASHPRASSLRQTLSSTLLLQMSESLPPQTTSLRFDDLDADIALISSDSVRFNVRSGFLLGSSVFERMLAIKIGKLEKGSEVKLDETAATLELLLSFLVRGSERPALGYDKIKEALKLADK